MATSPFSRVLSALGMGNRTAPQVEAQDSVGGEPAPSERRSQRHQRREQLAQLAEQVLQLHGVAPRACKARAMALDNTGDNLMVLLDDQQGKLVQDAARLGRIESVLIGKAMETLGVRVKALYWRSAVPVAAAASPAAATAAAAAPPEPAATAAPAAQPSSGTLDATEAELQALRAARLAAAAKLLDADRPGYTGQDFEPTATMEDLPDDTDEPPR